MSWIVEEVTYAQLLRQFVSDILIYRPYRVRLWANHATAFSHVTSTSTKMIDLYWRRKKACLFIYLFILAVRANCIVQRINIIADSPAMNNCGRRYYIRCWVEIWNWSSSIMNKVNHTSVLMTAERTRSEPTVAGGTHCLSTPTSLSRQFWNSSASNSCKWKYLYNYNAQVKLFVPTEGSNDKKNGIIVKNRRVDRYVNPFCWIIICMYSTLT